MGVRRSGAFLRRRRLFSRCKHCYSLILTHTQIKSKKYQPFPLSLPPSLPPSPPPFVNRYSSYVSNYDRAMETLLHLIETRLDFAAFVRGTCVFAIAVVWEVSVTARSRLPLRYRF